MFRKIAHLEAGLFTAAALALAATGAAVAASGDATVDIRNFDFSPMALTVPVGATVTWTNHDGEPHTVTSLDGTFRSAALDEGDSFRFRFEKAGTYRYLCTVHPKMVGAVTVK